MFKEKEAGNSLPTVFSYGYNELRTIHLQNQPWFSAKDICGVLGIGRTGDAIEKLDDDEKLMRKISASGQSRKMWFVNESGLYNLIFRSNKPEAKVFRKWVTSEVLPAIRKTGSYEQPSVIDALRSQKEVNSREINDLQKRKKRLIAKNEQIGMLLRSMGATNHYLPIEHQFKKSNSHVS